MTNTLLLFIFFALFIFTPIIFFIIDSQKEYKEENDDVIRLKIWRSAQLFTLCYLITLIFTCFMLLFSAYHLFKDYSLIHLLIGIVFIVFVFIFSVLFLNVFNHYIKELRREVYYFRNQKVLLVVENGIEIKIDLKDLELKIYYVKPRKDSVRKRSYNKYQFLSKNKEIVISELINFPHNFFDENKYTIKKVNRLFIWI